MTTTHTNLALVEGEVYAIDTNEFGAYHGFKTTQPTIKMIYGDLIYLDSEKVGKVLWSTAKHDNTLQLDRKHFVKPKVDVDELASNYAEREQRVLWENEHIVSEAFKSGYKAKEAEFTKGHMFDLFCRMGTGKVKTIEDWNKYMNEIQPLELPKSIEVDDDFSVKNVIW